MARPLRIEYEGAWCHVMNRGNGRQRVFHGDEDYGLFLEKLARPVETFRVSLRAFCLMPNHFRLYIATPEPNLSRLTPLRVRSGQALRRARPERTLRAGQESHDAC